MNVLVTGATGLIGSFLCEALVRRGLAGALVSSTAVTLSMSGRAKQQPELAVPGAVDTTPIDRPLPPLSVRSFDRAVGFRRIGHPPTSGSPAWRSMAGRTGWTPIGRWWARSCGC